MNPRTTPSKKSKEALDKLRAHLKEIGIIGGEKKEEENPYDYIKPEPTKEEKERAELLKDIPF